MQGTQGACGLTGRFNATRRFVLAGVVVCLTLAGHAAGGGVLPGTAGLFLAVVLAGALAFAATGRRRTLPWLLGFLLGAQVLIHVVLVISSPHAHGGTGLMPLLPAGSTAWGHLVASVVAAAVLGWGEQTLSSWANLLSVTFRSPATVVAPVFTCVRPPIERAPWALIPAELVGHVGLRGPPVAVTA